MSRSKQQSAPLTAAVLLVLFVACAAHADDLRAGRDAPRPRVELAPDAVVVTVGGQRLSVSLADAVLTLATPCGNWTLEPSIQLGKGWTRPGRASEKPRVVEKAGSVQVEIRYPVPEEREFVIEAEARARMLAVFVTSRLRLLSGTRGQYYYWQSNLSADHWVSPGPKGPERHEFDTEKWHTIDWANWWFLAGAQGGLAVLPTNCGGRAPGKGGCVFLHALPRSNVISAGESLDASFGLAGVTDAEAADALSTAALAGKMCQTHFPTSEKVSDTIFPAPKWLREAECYNLYYRPAAQWTEEVVQGKLRPFPFIIGSTPDKAALDKCHAAGVKLLHYVVYTSLLNTEAQVRGGGTVYSEWTESIDHETRDLKDHPDWVCIDAEGKPLHDGWGLAHHHPGLMATCLHHPGLHEAAVRQVKMLMERGFDGVFVDLAGPVEECHGPEFGKHTHPDSAKTNTEAYEQLLREIYAAVKSYGDDRVVIQNTCVSIEPSHWPYADVQMLEAYPYGESTELRATWPELQWTAARHGEAARHGRAPVILPYFSGFKADQVKEPALFSYAYARLYGLLWADGLTLADIAGNADFAKALYEVRLGKPTSEVKPAGAALYRRFEQGVVVLNPNAWAMTADVPVAGGKALRDVGYGRELTPTNGAVRLELAPTSGRVLLRGGE